MKVLLLDDVKSRKGELTTALEKSKYKVTVCSTCNEFISAVEDQSIGCLCLDYDTWHKGRSIYGYFNIPKRMERTPIIVYNSPTHYSAITNRAKHEKDRMLPKPTEAFSLVEAVAQCA
jgi:DNA-binding NtrC family response regulator